MDLVCGQRSCDWRRRNKTGQGRQSYCRTDWARPALDRRCSHSWGHFLTGSADGRECRAGAEVTILHVVGPPDDCAPQLLAMKASKFRESAQAVIRLAQEHGRQVLMRSRKVLALRGLIVYPVLVEGHPAEEIIRAATRAHADLVILGSRGMTGLKGAFLGSVSRRVARHAPCSVLVVKTR